MKVLRIILYILFLDNVIFGQYATVNDWNVVMQIPRGREKNEYLLLVPGNVVSIDKVEKESFKVSFNGINGMVEKKGLVLYNEVFSNVKERIVLSPKIVHEGGKDFLFYFKDGEFFKYNISERFVLQQRRLFNIQQVFPSTKSDLFLVKGIITNEEEIYNLSLFDFSNGKTTYIGSFAERNFSLMDVKFSKDGEFLCILFNVKGSIIACIYRTQSGEMISFAKNVLKVNWMEQILILNDKNNFWYYHFSNFPPERDISFRKDFLLFKIKPEWTVGRALNGRVVDELLYLETKQGTISYNFKKKDFSPTPFRSVIFNNEKTLNYFLRNESVEIWNIKLNRKLELFSGKQPPLEFIRFCENKILGRGKYEKIDTLFLYSEEGKELYRYRAVDSPEAFGDKGILAETFIDKNLSFITIENPVKQEFFFIVYKDKN